MKFSLLLSPEFNQSENLTETTPDSKNATPTITDSFHLPETSLPKIVSISRPLNAQDLAPKKSFKFLTKRVRGYIILLVLIGLSAYSYIEIRFNTLEIRPFNFCFLNNSLLTLLIPISFIKNIIRTKWLKNNIETTSEELLIRLNRDSLSDLIDNQNNDKSRQYNKQFYLYCLLLMSLWTLATTSLYYGIALSSSVTVNALANISIIIILIGKVAVLNNRVSIMKIISALVCMVGLFLLTNFRMTLNSTGEHFPLIGSILTVLSAIFYSAYVLVLKYFSKKYKHYFDMMEVFGYIGLFNLFILPFLLIFLTFLKIEHFTLPSSNEVLRMVFNGLITGLLCDQMQSYAITYLSPLVVALGIGLIVPFLYGFDMFMINSFNFNIWYVMGTLLMIISFLLIVIEHIGKLIEKRNKKEQYKFKKEHNDIYESQQ